MLNQYSSGESAPSAIILEEWGPGQTLHTGIFHINPKALLLYYCTAHMFASIATPSLPSVSVRVMYSYMLYDVLPHM